MYYDIYMYNIYMYDIHTLLTTFLHIYTPLSIHNRYGTYETMDMEEGRGVEG